jgi:hypothetical protein
MPEFCYATLKILISSEEIEETLKKILTSGRVYTQMSLERRALVFTSESFYKIERAYQVFAWFSEAFSSEFEKYHEKNITINELRNKLEMESVRKEIEDALKLLYEETDREWTFS